MPAQVVFGAWGGIDKRAGGFLGKVAAGVGARHEEVDAVTVTHHAHLGWSAVNRHLRSWSVSCLYAEGVDEILACVLVGGVVVSVFLAATLRGCLLRHCLWCVGVQRGLRGIGDGSAVGLLKGL